MNITERVVGDITVFDLHGALAGEADELLKLHTKRALRSGRRKVVLNLAEVPYVDSPGNGAIVRTFTTVSRSGGRLVLLNPRKRVIDLLSITKLLIVYEIFDSESEALASFQSVGQISACPICRCRSALGASRQATHRCANCFAEFALAPCDAQSTRQTVELVSLPTYEQERVVLRPGNPYTLTVRGRLDLFCGEVVEEACRAVPRPRKVLIDLAESCDLITSRGLRLVVSLCAPDSDGGRAAILFAGARDTPDVCGIRIRQPPFFASRSEAIAALQIAEGISPSPMVVEVTSRLPSE